MSSPVVNGLRPSSASSGTTVVVRGSDLGTDQDDIRGAWPVRGRQWHTVAPRAAAAATTLHGNMARSGCVGA